MVNGGRVRFLQCFSARAGGGAPSVQVGPGDSDSESPKGLGVTLGRRGGVAECARARASLGTPATGRSPGPL